MKSLSYIFKPFLLVMCFVLVNSCEQDFVNPNAPTDAVILSTKDGLLNLAVGVRQLYSTNGLRFIIETPAVTTREVAITTTFQNMIELEDGGGRDVPENLPPSNTNVEGLWSNMLRVIAMCEDIIENAPQVEMDAGTRSGLIAYAHLFKAMSIGAMSQNYESVIVQTSPNNDADFISRMEGFNTAIQLLEDAQRQLSTTAPSADFNAIKGNIDLEQTISAMLARYNLFAGNYTAAITAASAVDPGAMSTFTYDDMNINPVWNRVFQGGAPNFKPRDNFGLPASFSIDPNDGRIAFYLDTSSTTNQNGLPIEELKGFFTSSTSDLPVFLPGEMQLIIAEANVRKSPANLSLARAAIDAVRTKNGDPFGVDANLSVYMGPSTEDAILDEIYMNRRIELFLNGLSLEDSRRFNRPQPSPEPRQFDEERNRNFYPFPLRERSNNDKTPADPPI